MAAPRVIYLSPRLLRASETSLSTTARRTKRAAFSSTSRRWLPEAATQRYGTANEPPAHLGGGRAIPLSAPRSQEEKKLPSPEPEEKKAPQQEQRQVPKQPPQYKTSFSEPHLHNQEYTDVQARPGQQQDTTAVPALDGNIPDSPTAARVESSSALQNILQMQPPMSTATDTAPPHLQTPRHVHHFDTYTLVRDLERSGTFSDAQATTIMKGLRVILADNIDLARAGLMSRSDAEMDAYQFRAASSELRTEMRQRRNAAAERMRADRSQLQHEVDIIGQRMTQESLNLKDELKGMFDDRRMAVRTERRVLDNRIQELGYKITVAMNSGMRNEIEGLRFLVTRNAAITLAAFVAGSLMALYMGAKRKARVEKEERDRRDKEKYERTLRESGQLRRQEPDEKDILVKSVEQGGDPSLVSLG